MSADIGKKPDPALAPILARIEEANKPAAIYDDPVVVKSHFETSQTGARIKVLSLAELEARPRPSWRVRGLLPETGLCVVYGASGAGKTFAVVDMALAIALGRPWLGRRTKKGRVVYVATEGALSMRLQAYRRHYGLADLGDFGVIEQSINLLGKDDRDALIDGIHEAGGADVVVIDTLNRAMPGGDENSPSDMGRMVESAKQIETAFNCAVVFVHHTGKDPKQGARGHSSLKAATDAEISVKGGTGPRTITAEKVREGESGVEVGAFTLKSIDLGASQDPDAEAEERDWSCVIVPCDVPKERGPKLNDAARAALDHFHRVMDNHAAIPSSEAQKMAGKKRPKAGQTGCPADKWKTACMSSGSMSDGDKPDSQRTGFNRARKRLESAGVLVVSGEWVWLADKSDKAGQT